MSKRLIGLRSFVFALSLVAVFGAAVRAADSVVLKPKTDAPQDVYVEFDSTAVQTMDGPDGKPMEIKSRSVFGMLQHETPKDGGMIIDATIDRLLGDMAFSPSMRSIYDTDEPDYEEASPMHRDTFGPIMNATLRITLDKNGVATGSEGGKILRDKLTAMGEQNFVAASLAQTEFTDAQIQSMFGETGTILFPYKEVRVGDTWKKVQKDVYPQVGKVIINYDCALASMEVADHGIPGGQGGALPKATGDRIAVIAFKGVVTKDADDKPEKDKRLGKIDGTFSGMAKFDTQLGRFVEITRDMKAKMEVPPWFTKDANVPLMKINGQFTMKYTAGSTADRLKAKDEVAKRIADKKAREEAEEAAEMAGPVEPVTPENAPVAWTQWGGPSRDFRSEATGLANKWPKDGPPKLWERALGDGYSAVLADGDAVYTMYAARDKADAFKGDEVVIALDAKTGKTVWEYKYAAPWPKDFDMSFGAGPYSTPLIVGDRIFTVGVTAILNCLDKKTGKVIWTKDLHKDHKAELLGRGYGASPVAFKDTIILPVSKEKGKAVMAFAQSDGAVAWAGGEFEPGYATLLPIDVDGTEQIVAFTGKAVVGIDPVAHTQTWSVEHPTQWGANISTPVWNKEDGNLFVSSAYGMGSRGVKLAKAGSQVEAKETWFNPKFKIQHADAVRVGDWIYGSSGDFGPAFLASVNAKTGEFGWRKRGIAKANVLYADGKLIVLDEDGSLFLVKAQPDKFRMLGKAKGICQKKNAWTVPTLVGRTLYLRDREKVVALDLGDGK